MRPLSASTHGSGADQHTKVDVAVVGYGPVGQVLTALLGSRGYRITAIERHGSLYPLPRAGHFDHEIMRIFQSLGLAAEIARVSTPARRYEMLRADGTCLVKLPRQWATPSGWDASFHMYQPWVEEVVDAAARRHSGVEVLQGWDVEDVCDLGDHAIVRTRHQESGESCSIEAGLVVGADGANSIVRECVGIRLEDLGFYADWLVVDLEMKAGRPIPDIPDTGQVCDPARPSHMAKMVGPFLRWEFMLVDGDVREQILEDATVWRLLSKWVKPADATLIRKIVYTFRSAIASPWRVGRAILAGDSAHLMPPFLGQGMCSGIRDAATLSWIIDLVLRGVSEHKLLDRYELTRSFHVRRLIEESVRVGRLVCITDPADAAARDALFAAGPPEEEPILPKAGPALVRASDPLGGMLSVQPLVKTAAGTVLLDDIAPTGFRLIGYDLDPGAQLSAAQARLFERLGGRLFRVGSPGSGGALEDADGRFSAWVGRAGAVAVLIRPDFYVYGSANSADHIGALVDALGTDVCLTT